MKSFFKILYCTLLFFIYTNTLAIHIFADNVNSSAENTLSGIWENGGRFIQFIQKNQQITENNRKQEFEMRVILKPYYRYVYEDNGSFTAYIESENDNSLFYLRIAYPYTNKSVVLPIRIENGCFFTSFYKRVKYETIENAGVNDNPKNGENKQSPIFGFWIEQGTRNGILLYPNDAAQFIDAYFFTDSTYFRFRYWLDDLAYNEKKVKIQMSNGTIYELPRMIQRGDLVYSCVTSSSKELRNYESGYYFINADNSAETGNGLFLTLRPVKAGPGSHASADTYPNQQFIETENIPLYIFKGQLEFAIGAPYLFRSQIENLDEEIQKHNSKQKPAPEPALPPAVILN